MNLLTAITITLLAAEPAAPQPVDVEHTVVYSEPSEFAGWPANEGMWQWGDEVLVGFNRTKYLERDDMHNVEPDARIWTAFARSLDGGATWSIEEHPEVSIPARLAANGDYVNDPDAPPIAEPRPCPGGIDFTAPGFAMKLRNEAFYVTSDRGQSWEGPFTLPAFGQAEKLMARTNYVVVDKDTCRIFVEGTSVPRSDGEHGRTMMIETRDGGKTFEFVTWLTPDPMDGHTKAELPIYSLMPGVAMLDDGTMLATLRERVNRHKWVDLHASQDGGRTWQKLSTPFDHNNNPASLVPLGGQRVAAIYGWRNKPFGIRAKISEDGGRTWSQEYVLRDDGREWDLGYVRAALRPDGKILAIYYYTTADRPAQHIAATVWTPPAPDAAAATPAPASEQVASTRSNP